jgi:hypothetical protein
MNNRYYKKTFLLRAITGHPDDHGYLTMVWAASDRPSEWRPASWVHKYPMNVRNKPPHLSVFTANGSQVEEHMRSYDADNTNGDDDADDDDESPELQAAMAVFVSLEAEMVNRIFALEAKLLKEEIRVETTFTVRAEDDEDTDEPEDKEKEQNAQYSDEEDDWMEDGDQSEDEVQEEAEEEDEEEEEEEEEYSDDDDEWMEDADELEGEEDEEEEDYSDDADEWMEEITWQGQGAHKRTRAQYEEDDESEYERKEVQVGDEDEHEDDGSVAEEQAMAPSPPTKRAKFAHPCVVPLCDKGYANKVSLQRHVFSGHTEVSDPVARRACRLLWGETFKGGRLGDINRRYGEYPQGA